MAIWNPDLTTEDGAMSAAQLGGYACFVAAVLSVVGLVLTYGLYANGSIAAIVGLITLAEIVLYAAAGFRLNAGKGFYLGIVAALLLALELTAKVVALAFSIAMVINLLLLIVTISGVRGAWALRKGIANPEDDAAIFS